MCLTVFLNIFESPELFAFYSLLRLFFFKLKLWWESVVALPSLHYIIKLRLFAAFFYKGRNGKTFGWGANKSFLVSLIRQRWSIFCTKCIKKEGSFPPLWPATEVEEPLIIVNLGLPKGQRSPKEYHIICHTILVDLDILFLLPENVWNSIFQSRAGRWKYQYQKLVQLTSNSSNSRINKGN